MNRHLSLVALAAAAVVAPMTTSGCLVASSKDSHISGAYVQPGSVSQVRLNQSTTTDAEEIMGQPSTRTSNDDGSETWTWNWTKTTDDSGALFLIFAGSTEKTVHESVHIKFRDGVAIKKWRD